MNIMLVGRPKIKTYIEKVPVKNYDGDTSWVEKDERYLFVSYLVDGVLHELESPVDESVRTRQDVEKFIAKVLNRGMNA